ncbi:MerR family transcriptional regulator [uncultured Tateyamaria sp.]|uniref:MerR family transcriptional regulator n=1 Tax=uncultured Tateyamaria sp. TaxID=455651 RepID=UPI00263892A9|nr:MerR family transcriptional regulator [uncultured Tateyamaria sp.]
MSKSADAFRTISEVAEWLGVQTHVLRFWESKFTQVKPVKRAGGRRYYRPTDMLLLGGIRKLLHDDGLTIKGVQKILREEGMAYVADMSPPLDAETDAQLDGDLAAPIDEDVATIRIEAEIVPFTSHAEPDAALDDMSEDVADVEPDAPAAPADIPPEAPLPSFLRTPTPSPDDPVPEMDEQQGLPYPPLVEDLPPIAADEVAADDLSPAPEETASPEDDSPILAEERLEPAAEDEPEAFEPIAEPPEPVDVHMEEQAEPAHDDALDAPQEIEQVGALPSFLSGDALSEPEQISEPEQDVQPEVAAFDAMPEPEHEPEPEPEVDTPAEPAAPVPRIVNAPDDPDPATIAVEPSALSKVAGLTSLNDAQRNMIRPLLAQLASLRDQMANNRREPR